MFEWLQHEIEQIRTPRFHVVGTPAGQRLQPVMFSGGLRVPLDYREFLMKFGNVKLYRNARNNAYRIVVFAAPREEILADGSSIYHIGSHDGSSVYMKPSGSLGGLQIFEFEEDTEEKAAETFEQWLKLSCVRARKAYGKIKWAEILHGPTPFTAEEEEIVEARRRMRWLHLGIDKHGDQIFQVTNEATRALRALTIGVRSTDGRLNGAVRLNVGNIAPGRTDVLRVNCYKDLIGPEEIEVYGLPDPKPEDREFYWELDEI